MKKYKHLFGPLMSRRFGKSLGIDLCPMKTCSYDCIFCQLGKTTEKTIKRRDFFPIESICDEITDWLKTGDTADYITLAGSGEPTLYLRFGELIDFIHSITSIPVLLLSNGSLFWQSEVRRAAAKADVVKLSLSAWNPTLFDCINRPVPAISFDDMINGETAFRKEFKNNLIIEVFLIAGMNAIESDVENIAKYVTQVNPDTIHLNTVTRPAVEPFAFSVDKTKLELFSKKFTPMAIVPTDVSGSPVLNNCVDRIKCLDLIKRRPITLEQLADTFGAHPNEIAKITGELLRNRKVRIASENGNSYFTAI